MLRTLMISAAATALLAGSAMAQSSAPIQNDQSTPTQNGQPMQSESTAPTPSSEQAKFISQQGADHWVFSKFKGTDVLGPKNEHIGDVNDLVFDKGGKITGLVVGVGGFLGIGGKNIALAMDAFQVMPASNGAGSSADNDPTNVKLKVSWTKDELKNAPDFNYYKASSGNAAPTTGMGGGSPPASPPASPSPSGQ
jgi:hypothetical protein